MRDELAAQAESLGLTGVQAAAWIEQEFKDHRRRTREGFPEVRYVRHVTRDDDPSVFAEFFGYDHIGDAYWQIRGDLAHSTTGALVIRRFALEPLWTGASAPPDAFDVNTTVLRNLSLARIRDRAARHLREVPGRLDEYKRVGWPVPDDAVRAAIDETAAAAGAPVPRVGRPGRGDDYYRRIARSYLAKLDERAAANQSPRGLVAEIAEELGLTRTQARDAIRIARSKQFLTRGKPGRAGAEPGPLLPGG